MPETRGYSGFITQEIERSLAFLPHTCLYTAHRKTYARENRARCKAGGCQNSRSGGANNCAGSENRVLNTPACCLTDRGKN